MEDQAYSTPNSLLNFQAPPLPEAEAYCRRLARSHYENFTVASWLLPRGLRQHFHNIYAWCRHADDLADETGDSRRSVALLEEWRSELTACYRGRARHPITVALTRTVEEFQIPPDPFERLLAAFRRDQEARGFATFPELLGYCANSANPVGELVLYLGRSHTPACVELSNSICTGLQLVNFWQDVARDAARGRVYLPVESRVQFGVSEQALAQREATPEFRKLLAFEVDRAERYLLAGQPLVQLVPRSLRLEVELFVRGGLSVVSAIRRGGYDVWTKRPTVGRWAKLRILAAAWWATRRPPGERGA